MVRIVIGSWGSYNECNERALGSKWLDLEKYETWEEIEEELRKEGFELEGIDEELFIQDIEGFDSDGLNCDSTHPKHLFELLKESEVLEDSYKKDVMDAYLEVRSFSEFEDLVNQKGCRWDDDIILWRGFDWADYGREYFESCCYTVPDHIADFIDWDGYGQYIGSDCAEEYSDGIVEIR